MDVMKQAAVTNDNAPTLFSRDKFDCVDGHDVAGRHQLLQFFRGVTDEPIVVTWESLARPISASLRLRNASKLT